MLKNNSCKIFLREYYVYVYEILIARYLSYRWLFEISSAPLVRFILLVLNEKQDEEYVKVDNYMTDTYQALFPLDNCAQVFMKCNMEDEPIPTIPDSNLLRRRW